MNNSSIVVGLKSYSLAKDEKEYFKKFKPLGVILFKRNIFDKKQVNFLTKQVRTLLGPKALILIEEEGGRVSRLNNKSID